MRIGFCFLSILMMFANAAGAEQPLRRGLFVSVIQSQPLLSSRKEITHLITFAKQADIKILFIQIYRANQAWFPSKLADASPYEMCLKSVAEDPFAFLIREAHKSGIEVHAWINLLSLSTNKDAKIIKKYGNDILTSNVNPKRKLDDYRIDNQYFLEPGDPRVRKELSDIVAEILKAYPDLDGIQYDYIRYPDQHPFYGYTKENLKRFRKAAGITTFEEKNPAWQTWKRGQVTEFVGQLVKKARSIRPKIQVSTTGCASYNRAYYEAFQDWPLWLNSGLVDFVTLMSYPVNPLEYQRNIAEAKSKVKDVSRLNIAIAAYKLVKSPDVFAQQLRICETAGAGACVVFHYGSLLDGPALKNVLKQE